MRKLNQNLVHLISFVFLIVVTDPYRNLNYNKINVYQIKDIDNSITYHESDGFSEKIEEELEDDDIDDITEKLYKIKLKKELYDSIYMYNSNNLFTPLKGYRNL